MEHIRRVLTAEAAAPGRRPKPWAGPVTAGLDLQGAADRARRHGHGSIAGHRDASRRSAGGV